MARATGWTPPERETDAKAKTAINSAAAAERGILAGKEPFCAR